MLKRTDYLTRTYGKPEGWTLATYERELGGYAGRAARAHDDDARAGRRRGEEGEHPRPRRRRLPHGRQVELHAQGRRARSRTTSSSTPTRASPGTHKDRTLMELNPHACVEGCIIACYGIGAHVAYIYVRDELHLSQGAPRGRHRRGASAKGYLGKTPFGKDYPVEVYVHSGAGAYICGEETSMLNSHRGAARRAAHEAAVPGQRRRLRLPDHGEQPRDDRRRAHRVRPWAARSSASSRALHRSDDGGVRLYGVNGHVKKPARSSSSPSGPRSTS